METTELKYTCDICGYIAINEDVIENHILDKHERPDEDGEFKCSGDSWKDNLGEISPL